MDNREVIGKLKGIRMNILGYRIALLFVGLFYLIYFFLPERVMEDERMTILTYVMIIITGPVVAIGVSGATKLKGKSKELYNDLLSSMIEYAYYEQDRGFTDIEVGTFGIIKIGNIYYSNNYFQGHYKGVGVRQADVIIQKETYIDEKSSITKYFDGRIFEFTTDKITAQNVKVFSRGYESWLNINDRRVDVDDLFFNDNFDVFSAEPSEAQEILTREMIEHLLILQNQNRSIGFRFGVGKVFVAINGTRQFDVNSIDKIMYDKDFVIAKEGIQLIKDLIDGLGIGHKYIMCEDE
ncbi:MAG: DUF3137 domain-containing protein [Lachnospiraceae bacterium]|nr:DUF3137 domain-containing protein [Lachnospiraceae bacterium]